MVRSKLPVLEDLSRETGESGHFAVRMGDAVVVIARTSGTGAFQLTDRGRHHRPAPPPGKIILASPSPGPAEALPRARRAETIDQSRSPTPRHCCAKSPRSVAARCSDDGEFNPEVRCVAGTRVQFHRRGDRRARHFRPDLAHDRSRCSAKLVQAAAGRLSAEFSAKGLHGTSQETLPQNLPKRRLHGAVTLTGTARRPEISSNKKTSPHSRIPRTGDGTSRRAPGGRPKMTRYSRRVRC